MRLDLRRSTAQTSQAVCVRTGAKLGISVEKMAASILLILRKRNSAKIGHKTSPGYVDIGPEVITTLTVLKSPKSTEL